MATLTTKERSLIADVIFNQDFEFTAEEIRDQVFERFGLTFAVDLIEDVIEWLYKSECVEYDRCDRTLDLFAGA